jgi:hypothetical protein
MPPTTTRASESTRRGGIEREPHTRRRVGSGSRFAAARARGKPWMTSRSGWRRSPKSPSPVLPPTFVVSGCSTSPPPFGARVGPLWAPGEDQKYDPTSSSPLRIRRGSVWPPPFSGCAAPTCPPVSILARGRSRASRGCRPGPPRVRPSGYHDQLRLAVRRVGEVALVGCGRSRRAEGFGRFRASEDAGALA